MANYRRVLLLFSGELQIWRNNCKTGSALQPNISHHQWKSWSRSLSLSLFLSSIDTKLGCRDADNNCTNNSQTLYSAQDVQRLKEALVQDQSTATAAADLMKTASAIVLSNPPQIRHHNDIIYYCDKYADEVWCYLLVVRLLNFVMHEQPVLGTYEVFWCFSIAGTNFVFALLFPSTVLPLK